MKLFDLFLNKWAFNLKNKNWEIKNRIINKLYLNS